MDNSINHWGYIRETREMAQKAAQKHPNSTFTGLEDYLEVLYPGETWIHDKAFKHDGKSYRNRPDYLCEKKKSSLSSMDFSTIQVLRTFSRIRIIKPSTKASDTK